jgi:DNA adenine methylase
MPPHLHYCEPFAGSLAVLFAKPPGVVEVINDLNHDLTNFWRVLQDERNFARFLRVVEAVPFSEVEWKNAMAGLQHEPDADPVQRAVWFFVACRQSLAGRMNAFAPFSQTRTRRGMNEQVSAWITAVDGLPAVHARLRQVVVLNCPAVEVIRTYDGPDVLSYIDPPYLATTRAAPDIYAHEMSEAQHRELLDVLGAVQGKFLLSGYRSDLYDRAAERYGWRREEFSIANHAAGGAKKGRETEVLWFNF